MARPALALSTPGPGTTRQTPTRRSCARSRRPCTPSACSWRVWKTAGRCAPRTTHRRPNPAARRAARIPRAPPRPPASAPLPVRHSAAPPQRTPKRAALTRGSVDARYARRDFDIGTGSHAAVERAFAGAGAAASKGGHQADGGVDCVDDRARRRRPPATACRPACRAAEDDQFGAIFGHGGLSFGSQASAHLVMRQAIEVEYRQPGTPHRRAAAVDPQ